MDELKLAVLKIGTPFYSLLIREIDGSVCGVSFGDYSIAFGVICRLDLPGKVSYTPYHLRNSEGLTNSLLTFFLNHSADEYPQWVENNITTLTDEPCSNQVSLEFGASFETLALALATPSETKCFYPSIRPHVTNGDFSAEFVDTLIELNAKYGEGCVYSDYKVIWLAEASKGLSVDGNFVDIPADEEGSDEWQEA